MRRSFRAPGRVNLIGEHTDNTGGYVLPVAIDRAVVVTGEAGGDRIDLRSDRAELPVDVAANGSEPGEGWGRFVAAVAAELDARGRPAVGFTGEVRSDLPPGAGMSSSAALEVAVATALCRTVDLHLEPMELAAITQRAERRATGVPTGIMDQAASLLGRAGHALLLDCGTLDHRHLPLPDDLALLVIDSGVSRELECSEYAARGRELAEALETIGCRSPKTLTPEEAELLADRSGLDPRLRGRLRHVVTENRRVLEAEVALVHRGSAGRAALARILAAGHASLRDDLEVSSPELDLLVALAVESGGLAARLTGAGFGGAIVALVEGEGAAREVGERTVAEYGRRTGREATAIVCAAADGAGEVT